MRHRQAAGVLCVLCVYVELCLVALMRFCYVSLLMSLYSGNSRDLLLVADLSLFLVLSAFSFSVLSVVSWTTRPQLMRTHTPHTPHTQGCCLSVPYRGVSYEHIIQLANTLNIQPWVNVPVEASDDYMAKMASFFKERLNANLALYIEYSNEVYWNTMPGFTQGQVGGLSGFVRDTVFLRLSLVCLLFVEDVSVVCCLWSGLQRVVHRPLVVIGASQFVHLLSW